MKSSITVRCYEAELGWASTDPVSRRVEDIGSDSQDERADISLIT